MCPHPRDGRGCVNGDLDFHTFADEWRILTLALTQGQRREWRLVSVCRRESVDEAIEALKGIYLVSAISNVQDGRSGSGTDVEIGNETHEGYLS